TSQDFVNFVCSDALWPRFLQFLFLAEGEDLLRFASGSVHQTIYFPEAKAFHVCIPSLAEQQRIVGILDESFESIAIAKANLEQNRRNARALFESHLQSVFTQRGEGWIETTIGAEVDLLSGFAFKSKQYTTSQESVRLLRGDNIVQGSLRWDDVKRWPASDAADYARYQLRSGDVVIAMDRPWVKAGLKLAMISDEDLPCLLVQRTARLRTGAALDSRFLLSRIAASDFTAHVVGKLTGVGVPHISGQQIREFAFLRPPLDEQQRIANTLDCLRAETRKLEAIYQQRLHALEALKTSILDQTFSGQL
ncbi:MAG: restriction endonuclease subunit S, partial [Gemmatimonadaceae bacterium]